MKNVAFFLFLNNWQFQNDCLKYICVSLFYNIFPIIIIIIEYCFKHMENRIKHKTNRSIMNVTEHSQIEELEDDNLLDEDISFAAI